MSDRAEMKIKAIAPWFGSKRTLAPVIVQELGKHRAYWEPFCGSMAVLLDKPESGHETVNDLHRNLINLVTVIQHPTLGPKLYRRLRRVTIREGIVEESWRALEKLEDASLAVERAYHYFIASWSGRNGFAGTTNISSSKGIAVRWTPGGGHGGLRFGSAVESIPAWRRRIRRVTILHRDGFGVIDNISDEAGVSIYVDPPYLKKDATYEHDFDWLAHRTLAKSLARFKTARVVVSYYDHPDLAAMYPGWTVRDCTMTKGIHNAGKRGQQGKKAPEVLLINGPSYA